MDGLISRIEQHYQTLTKRQKKAADYVRAHLSDLAFETLERAASKMDVSTATVVRFAQALGYDGFTTLQKDLINEIKGNVGLPERLKKVETDIDGALQDWFEQEIQCLRKTAESLDIAAIEQVLSMIDRAHSVYVLGLRTCFAPAFLAASALGQVRRNVHLVQGISSTYLENIVSAGMGDVCLVISYPRYLRETQGLMRELKRYGVQVALFTEPTYSKITLLADVVVYTAPAPHGLKGSFAPLVCLLNYFVEQTIRRNPEESMRMSTRIERYLSENHMLDV